MKKSISHAVIVSASFLAAALLLVTGWTLAFILPRQSGHLSFTWLELSRESWQSLHYYFSLIFCLLLIIQLISHWEFIKHLAWGSAENPRSISVRASVILMTVLLALLLILPFLIPARESDKPTLHGQFPAGMQ